LAQSHQYSNALLRVCHEEEEEERWFMQRLLIITVQCLLASGLHSTERHPVAAAAWFGELERLPLAVSTCFNSSSDLHQVQLKHVGYHLFVTDG